MDFKEYPSYKNSGVEWLGDVPEHWDIFKSNKIFKQSNLRSRENDEQLTASQKYGVIPQSLYMKKEESRVVLALSGTGNFKHVDKNDFVISLRSFQGGIERCFYEGCVSPAYTVLKPNQVINHDFWAYLFKSTLYISALNTAVDGIREGKTISYTNFGEIYVNIPTLSEQNQIVSFLDTETARIDTLIAKQEKLIELLEEQRKSIISHAVTKGLNPNALMKDSGVEWLGRVPCDWQYYSIKRTIKVLTDYTANGSFADLAKNVNYLDYGFSRLVRLTDLREDLNNNGVYITEDAHKYLKKSELFGGELLLANVGAYAGFACLMPYKKIKATLAPNMFLLRFKEQRINNKFMYYLINSKTIQYQFQVSMTSTAQPKLNKDNVKNIVMFLPTLQIQNEIVEYLDSENLILDNLIFKQQALIEKLKEYRASIISHAVTGKIDVREHMA